MVFKKRMAGETLPESDHVCPASGGVDADREARLAEFLAALPDVDVTRVSVVLRENEAVLSGFVATALERLRIETALERGVPGLRIVNRLQLG